MMRMQSFLSACIIFLMTSTASMAAAEPIGHVKTTSGTAFVVNASGRVPASVGMGLAQNDRLETGANGSIGVTLRDNTRISLGADSEVSVSEFIFEPDREELSLVTQITKGSLLFVSGTIAKLKPEKVKVKTPTTTIGVRGTRFVVTLDGNTCSLGIGC